MATITGQRTTLNINQDRRRIDMADTIGLLEPESTPLTLLLNKIGSKKAVSPKFQWLEKELEPRFDAINNGAGYASGATVLTVDNGAYFAQHDLVEVTRTRELVRVVSVATNDLTVVRGVGSTAAAIVDNDELYLVGSAQPEGDTSKAARSSNPTTKTNYTQIFRLPFDETETMRASDVVTTEHDWQTEQKLKGIEHAKDQELAFWLGRPSEDSSGSTPRRSTGGVLHYVTTNATDALGAFSETELWTASRQAFRYGSRRKIAFAGGLPVQVMNGFATSKVQVRQGETTYGLAVTDYVSPFGTLEVMFHPLLEGAKYGGYIVVLDLDNVRKRPLAGGVAQSRDTHLRENIQENDRDGRKDEFLTEAGLELKLDKTHAIVTGITS